MKKNKKIKLSLNKQVVASLDVDALKGVKGGKAEFLSVIGCCKKSRSCTPTMHSACEHCTPAVTMYTACEIL